MTEVGSSCGVCGWPTTLSICPMCGYRARPHAVDIPTSIDRPTGLRAEDYPDLTDAFAAWNTGAYEEMVQATLAVLGPSERRTQEIHDRCGWLLTRRSAVLSVTYDRSLQTIAVEAPVVRIPQMYRVGLMRALLELNRATFHTARFCLRGEVVVLRFADRGENVAPPKLSAAVREVGREAERHHTSLSEKFGAAGVGTTAAKSRGNAATTRPSDELGGFDDDTPPPPPDHPASPVTGLLALLEETKALVDTHDAGIAHMTGRMICRAAVCRAWAEHRSASPAAATLVLDGGWPVILAPLGREEAVADVLGWLERLRTFGENLHGLAPAPISHLPDIDGYAREYVTTFLAHLEQVPSDPALRMFILLGGVAEVLTRTPVADEHADALRYALSWAPQAASSAHHCQQVATVLRALP